VPASAALAGSSTELLLAGVTACVAAKTAPATLVAAAVTATPAGVPASPAGAAACVAVVTAAMSLAAEVDACGSSGITGVQGPSLNLPSSHIEHVDGFATVTP
jgi:hypothetical protein